MVVLPFYAYIKGTKKPPFKRYNEHPQTIGEHIRKRRIELGLLQKDVAQQIGVIEDSITHWENGRYEPQVQHYPAIIKFLGYYPFNHETDTFAGKLMQIRYCNGLGLQQCATLFHISVDAMKRWERGKPILNPKLRDVIETVWQSLPIAM